MLLSVIALSIMVPISRVKFSFIHTALVASNGTAHFWIFKLAYKGPASVEPGSMFARHA
jgi:hypothetical protein